MRLFIFFLLILLSLASIQANTKIGAITRATINITPIAASNETQLIDVVENDKGFYLIGNLKGGYLKTTNNTHDWIVNIDDSNYQAFVISYDLTEPRAKFQWSRQTEPQSRVKQNCSCQFTAAVAQEEDIYLALNSSGDAPVTWGPNPIDGDSNVYILEIDDSRNPPLLHPSLEIKEKGLIESMIWAEDDDSVYLAVTGSQEYLFGSIYLSNGTSAFADPLDGTTGVYVGDYMNATAIIINKSNQYLYAPAKNAVVGDSKTFSSEHLTLQDYDMAEGSIFGLFTDESNEKIVEIKDDKPMEFAFSSGGCTYSMIRCLKHHNDDSPMLILLAGNLLPDKECVIPGSRSGFGFWGVVELDMTAKTTKSVGAGSFSGRLQTFSRRLYGANSIYAATVNETTIEIYEITEDISSTTTTTDAIGTALATTAAASTAAASTAAASTAAASTAAASTAAATTAAAAASTAAATTAGTNNTSASSSSSTPSATTKESSTATSSLSTTIDTTTSTTNGTEEGKPEAPSGKSIVIFLIFSFIILAIVALGYVWYNRQRIAGLGIAASTPMRRLSNLASSA